MELGKDVEDGAIEEKIAAQRPEQCALLIYTVRMYIRTFVVSLKCDLPLFHSLTLSLLLLF